MIRVKVALQAVQRHCINRDFAEGQYITHLICPYLTPAEDEVAIIALN